MRFSGWIPNATGRLSFSHMGETNGDHGAERYNSLGPSGGNFFAAYEERRSPDGSLLTVISEKERDPRVHYFATGETEPGILPKPNGAETPEMVPDQRAKLVGQVIILANSSDPSNAYLGINDSIRDMRVKLDRLMQAREPGASEDVKCKRMTVRIINRLNALRTANDYTAAFARCEYQIYRTGECHIDVRPEDAELLFEDYKSEHEEFYCGLLANYAFIFLKDLLHKHYHHDPASDKKTVVYSNGDDAHWRRETSYSLMRLAIESRRSNNIERYMSTLGILAYAECFEKSLGYWKIDDGEAVLREDYVRADFASLRTSIESKLKDLQWIFQRKMQVLAWFIAATIGVTTVLSHRMPSWIQYFQTQDQLKGYEAFLSIVASHPALAMSIMPLSTAYYAIGHRVGLRSFYNALYRKTKQFFYMLSGTIGSRKPSLAFPLVIAFVLLMIIAVIAFMIFTIWYYTASFN